jgi:5-methylcytosine-specific restriction endonuclease McrA
MKRQLYWRPKAPRLLRKPQAPRPKVSRSAARPSIPADARVFVWNRDGGRCRNCGARNNLQFDHVIPVALGGSNTAENLELLCKACNMAKGTRLSAPLRFPRVELDTIATARVTCKPIATNCKAENR